MLTSRMGSNLPRSALGRLRGFRYAVGMELAERTLAWLRGADPETDGADPYDETADALLAMGRLAAERLDPERIGDFRRLIEAEMRPGRFGDHPVFREWLRRADLGPDALANALLDCTERGRYMRSMAPLRAFVSKEERFDILRGVAREHGYGERPARRSANAE